MSKHNKHQNVTSLPDVVQNEEELQEQEEGGEITERFYGKDYIQVNTFAEVAKYTHNGNTTSVSALFNLYKDKDTVDGLFEPKHYITLRKDDEDTKEFFERYPDVPRSTKYLLTKAGFIALCSHSKSEQSRQVIAATVDKAITAMDFDIQAKSTDSMLKFFANLFSTNSNLNIEPFAKTFEILAENQKYEMETIRELNMQRMAFERDVAKMKIELQLEQLKNASEKALPRYTWFKNHVDVLIVTNLNTKEQKAFESQRSCYTEYGMVPAQLRKIVEEHRPWQVKKGSHEGEAIQIEKKPLSEYYTSELYKQAAGNN